MHWFLTNCVKMFFCLTSVATPLLWLLWVCAAAKFANINLFYVWEEKLYFTLCKSNGPPCPYVCNGPGRRFPQKIWKTHFPWLPSNIIRRGGIASSALKGRRSILNLDVRTNLEANLNTYCCGKKKERNLLFCDYRIQKIPHGCVACRAFVWLRDTMIHIPFVGQMIFQINSLERFWKLRKYPLCV